MLPSCMYTCIVYSLHSILPPPPSCYLPPRQYFVYGFLCFHISCLLVFSPICSLNQFFNPPNLHSPHPPYNTLTRTPQPCLVQLGRLLSPTLSLLPRILLPNHLSLLLRSLPTVHQPPSAPLNPTMMQQQTMPHPQTLTRMSPLTAFLTHTGIQMLNLLACHSLALRLILQLSKHH